MQFKVNIYPSSTLKPICRKLIKFIRNFEIKTITPPKRIIFIPLSEISSRSCGDYGDFSNRREVGGFFKDSTFLYFLKPQDFRKILIGS